jgi:glycosyl transferase family 87
MVAETSSLSRPEPRVLAAAFAAVIVFSGTWALLHVGFYTHDQILDTPVYQRYGNAIARGDVPYRDFDVEYPPGALPVFALPGFAEPGRDQDVTPGFRHAFESLMWLCGAGALLCMAVALAGVRASEPHVWMALTFAAVAPLALGSVVLSRFDLWPALLVVGALAALVSGWLRIGSGLLGLAITVKLFPAVLVPLALTHVWRRAGRREALVCAGVLAAVVAVVFLPFVIVSPGGVWHSLTVQLTRPLQIESLGSALLLSAHHAFGVGLTMVTSHGSQNLSGGAADALAAVETVVQIALLVGVWVLFALGPPTRSALVRSSAAAIAVFVAFGKVLSPQFLIWLIPVVPLVRGRRGLWASALLAAALVLTQLWFPFHYWDLPNHFALRESLLVLARDVTLVALAIVLALPERERAEFRHVRSGRTVPGTVPTL